MNQIAIALILTILATGFATPLKKFQRPRFDGRIIGGEQVTIEDNPWQVSLNVFGLHNCGGSLVSPTIVITAAHCADILLELFGEVVAGTANLAEGESVRAGIAEIITQENYATDPYQLNNDIAILRLDTELPFGPNIAAVQLPEVGDEPADGDVVLVTGWGLLNEGDLFSPSELYGVEVPIVGREACNDAYQNIPGVEAPEIDDTMICAGVEAGGKDACQGDSGGPLTKDGVLVGIVSWGYGCAEPRIPGVYTNVAYQRDWIAEHTGL